MNNPQQQHTMAGQTLRSATRLIAAVAGLCCVLAFAADEMRKTNNLAIGEAQLVPATGSNIVIATEGIIRAMPAGPGKLVISGIKNGRTDMLVLDDAGSVTERYQVIVAEHGEAKQTYQASMEDFRKIVKEIVGDHKVKFDVLVGPRIGFVGTNLVSSPKPVLFMHGEAKDEIEADAIRAVASRFYGAADYGSTQTTASAPSAYGTNTVLTTTITDLKNDPNIVDQMTIGRYNQVRIRIQVAEVDIEAIKNKGLRYGNSIIWGVAMSGVPVSAMAANPAAAVAGAAISGLVSTEGGGGGGLTTPAFSVELQTLIQDRYARLLAEPTLVAKSGQQAEFLAGGELIQQQITVQQLTTITIPFGVKMKIKPTVDRSDHIDMEITAEVSEAPTVIQDTTSLSKSTRTANTRLRLDNGSTLVLSGLLQNNMRNIIRKFPLLGQLPVLGALFRSKNWQNNQTELLFFVTPEIIRDVPSDTARNVRTPVMKQWHYMDSHKDVLPDPNSHAGRDNDIHDLLGIPPDRSRDPQPPTSSGFVPAGTPPSAPIAPPFSSPAAPSEPKAERKYQ